MTRFIHRVRYIGIEKLRSKHVATEMGGVSVHVRVTHKRTRAVCKESEEGYMYTTKGLSAKETAM